MERKENSLRSEPLQKCEDKPCGMAFGEMLVGWKLKVWWPLMKQYYEGVVHSFNRGTLKHKIVYDDGEVELLNLLDTKWLLVKDDMLLKGLEAARAVIDAHSCDWGQMPH